MAKAWKTIEGYNDRYSISSDGEVHSNFLRGCVRVQKINRTGYCVVTLACHQVYKTYTVHRLVAKYFLVDYNEELQVNHINGVKTDNRVENLEMCTASENIRHAVGLGVKFGAKTNMKLTASQVIMIRECYKHNSLAQLSEYFGVSKSAICNANSGKTWGDIV